MTHMNRILSICLSLAFALAGCDDPDLYAHEALEEQLEEEEPADLQLAADPATPEGTPSQPQIDTLKEQTNPTFGSCKCYTTCSSNGSGWTTTYYVGVASSPSSCSSLATSFCKGKSSTYKYHNSACT